MENRKVKSAVDNSSPMRLRRVCAVGLIVAPLIAHVVFTIFSALESYQDGRPSYFSIGITGFFLFIPFAYMFGSIPVLIGSFLLFVGLRKIKHSLQTYLYAALCGFGTMAFFTLGEKIEDMLLIGSVGILPAVTTMFFLHRGLLRRLDL